MAVPKKKQTTGRGRRRRSGTHLTPAAITDCPQCGQPKQRHRVCPTCGFYRSREVKKLLD